MSDARRHYTFVSQGDGPGPPEITRAEGAWLHRADGARILDAAGGAIVANVGHGRREVAEAMARAAEQEAYVVPVFATESRLRLTERLREHWLPRGLDRIYLSSGGSDAMDAAIRLARQHFVARGEGERWKIIGRDHSYHGCTVTTLAAGANEKRRAAMGPLLHDWPKAPAAFCSRCPLGERHPGCRVACADALERILAEEGARTVAAFVAEPVVGSTLGAVVPPDDYWPRIREICDAHGVLLIADEVMSGFGRTGRAMAVDHWSVVPDILVGGKGLAGGYAPLGGVYTSERVVAPMAQRGDELMFYTFGAHPAACAAADKVLEIMQREDLVARSARVGARLLERLRKLQDHPHVSEVRGLGLMLGVEFVRDKEKDEPFARADNFTGRVVAGGLAEGVFFYPAGGHPARDAVMLGPPFIVGDEEIELMADVLERAIDSALARTL